MVNMAGIISVELKFFIVFTKEGDFHFLAFSVILFCTSLVQTRPVILNCEHADTKIAQADD